MERKQLYKQGCESTESLRQKRRFTRNVIRKEKRELILSGKRMRADDDGEMQNDDITDEEVIEATKKLMSKSGDRKCLLKLLRQAFSQGTRLIDSFLQIENSLACLVGLFTGLDPEVQLEATWCLTNISAGTDDHANAVLKSAGPYLTTYLSSGCTALQDHCAWAVGNLAGGNATCRKTLRMQGALSPLINLLQSPASGVVRSAAFALSNLAKDEETQKDLIALEIIPKLASQLVYESDKLDAVAEVSWIFTYLSASGNHSAEILSAGVLPRVARLIVEASNAENDNFMVLTPLLRCLGNIICNVPEVDEIIQDDSLFRTAKKLLHSKHLHIWKETLWVLSNISVFESACDVILKVGLLPDILSLLSSTFDIRKEAAFTLCNFAAHGDRFCSHLYDNGVLGGVIPLLKSPDPEACHLALSLVEMIFHYNPDQAVKEFEEHHGLDCLEALEYSSNEPIRNLTNDLLEMYFYKEDSCID